MPHKDRQRLLEYHRRYNAEHSQQRNEYMESYRQAHREHCRQYAEGYYQTHQEEQKLDRQEYRLAFRQELVTIYSDKCYFCKGTIELKDLALHHIQLDGETERKLMGGGTMGRIRSYRQAIEHPDSTRYASVHMSCHSGFHHKGRRLKRHEPS
jgi:hypothetical protein